MPTLKHILKYGSMIPAERAAGALDMSAKSNAAALDIKQWAVPRIEPIAENQRGVILGPPVVYEGTSLSTREFDLTDLRCALLFFDKIAYAANNIIHISPPSEIDWLASEGVAEVVECRGQGTFDTRCVIEAQKALHRTLDRDSPGVWGIWRGDNHAMFLADETEARRGLQMKLIEAIPVPDKDVPLEDVLTFKSNRYDELSALRFHLERLYQSILESPDRPLAERTEIEALRMAVRDHLRVTDEAGLRVRFTDLGVNFTANDALAGYLAFAGARQKIDLSDLEAAGVGLATAAVGAMLSIGVGASIKSRAAGSRPFEYVSKYHNEVFG